ncbi:Rieske (2Fe-2S) protein [Sphingobium sp. TCM1]|uniref:Rieske (2Fe-2S) protein n=1 Tax=Sphingobium sp. TCM1 TaxID=453246 RepID=UPI0007F45327|nr:Rieske (2Fe-2S) protein [Sphingobium sp. TCM1]OAN56232.1 hypothetical protein A7Q26_02145 [Sphingobium sp. TCM1]
MLIAEHSRQPIAIALSEEVTSLKPLGVDIGDQQIVLWRDGDGVAHALEDRCPHRRAPLSLGCVRQDGHLQCGYHGWSFDGTGQIIDIPQIRQQAKLPAIYSAQAFPTIERDGFVFVGDAAQAAPQVNAGDTPDLPLHGTAYSPVDQARLMALLLDGPQLLIALPGIHISEYPLADPQWLDGMIVYERACRRSSGLLGGRWLNDHWRAEFPFALRFMIHPRTGFCRLVLRDGDNEAVMEAALSLVEARRGTTAIRWRARHRTKTGRRPPLSITGSPDGNAMRILPRDVSTILHEPAMAHDLPAVALTA